MKPREWQLREFDRFLFVFSPVKLSDTAVRMDKAYMEKGECACQRKRE